MNYSTYKSILTDVYEIEDLVNKFFKEMYIDTESLYCIKDYSNNELAIKTKPMEYKQTDKIDNFIDEYVALKNIDYNNNTYYEMHSDNKFNCHLDHNTIILILEYMISKEMDKEIKIHSMYIVQKMPRDMAIILYK